MRDVTVVLKYEIPAIRNSDFLTGNHTISTKQNNHLASNSKHKKDHDIHHCKSRSCCLLDQHVKLSFYSHS